jgi:hypothetical protein
MWANMLWVAFLAGLGLLVHGAMLALDRSHVDRMLAICRRHGRKVSAISHGRRESKIEFESSGSDAKASEELSRPVVLDGCSEQIKDEPNEQYG